jgi:hypothetical protein
MVTMVTNIHLKYKLHIAGLACHFTTMLLTFMLWIESKATVSSLFGGRQYIVVVV